MRLAFAALLLAQVAQAQTLAVSIMDAQGVSDEKVKRVHAATVELLKQLTALPVSDALDWRGPKKSCARDDEVCRWDKVRASGGAVVVALWLKGGSFMATACWDGYCPDVKAAEEGALQSLLEAVLPQWARKGWGGIRLSEELQPGTVLKLDGRVLGKKRQDVVAVTAGAHELDVLFPDGRAVLQRIDVVEGSRTRVQLSAPPSAATSGSGAGLGAVRVASYVTWMVGTATLLSALIVGFVGRQTASGQSPCRPDSRECVTYAMAEEQQRKAAGYASIANVLLGTGLVVSLAGAGFFTFDLMR